MTTNAPHMFRLDNANNAGHANVNPIGARGDQLPSWVYSKGRHCRDAEGRWTLAYDVNPATAKLTHCNVRSLGLPGWRDSDSYVRA